MPSPKVSRNTRGISESKEAPLRFQPRSYSLTIVLAFWEPRPQWPFLVLTAPIKKDGKSAKVKEFGDMCSPNHWTFSRSLGGRNDLRTREPRSPNRKMRNATL